MSDDPRWDREMRAARQAMDATAATFPPVEVVEPMDPQRAVNDMLTMAVTHGGPAIATTSEFWIYANGRRVFCRLHRPHVGGVLPVLVWFHGGGWVWLTVDTHDRLVRELATAGGVATVSVDYTLSPEAKFPQALAECAGVVRGLAAAAANGGSMRRASCWGAIWPAVTSLSPPRWRCARMGPVRLNWPGCSPSIR